jgi:hypothetical protein
MKKWLARIRGVLVISALFYAVAGFFSGIIFSALLGITQRRRTFDEMSLPVFAVGGRWGGFSRLYSLLAVRGRSHVLL